MNPGPLNDELGDMGRPFKPGSRRIIQSYREDNMTHEYECKKHLQNPRKLDSFFP